MKRRIWIGPAVVLVAALVALPAADRAALAQASDPAALARLEVRLARIEEELRRLTGRIEETEFAQRRINGRIDQLISDLDARLAALEQAMPPADGSASGGEAARAPTPATPGAPAESEGGSLGSVPEGDLATLPEADPGAATAPARPPLLAREQYDAAMALLRGGDYAGAERGLEVFLEVNPDNLLAPNAAYWLAESLYVRGDYAGAAAAFARNYRTYGDGAAKAPDNLLKLGMALHQLGQDQEACRAFEELDDGFPDPPAHIRQALGRERSEAGCQA
jgi:tol-pal system protein YbgF